MGKYDFKVTSDVLNGINTYADDIMDILNDEVPFFMVFAVENANKKTEYKMFYTRPSELGLILNVNKFSKIMELFSVPNDGTPAELKDWHMSSKAKQALTQKVYELSYYCHENNVPCFLEFATSNKNTGTENAKTDYLMDLVSPFRLMIELYDDNITKVLRYTYDPDIYPSNTMEIEDDFMDIDEIESFYNTLDEDNNSNTNLGTEVDNNSIIEDNIFSDFPLISDDGDQNDSVDDVEMYDAFPLKADVSSSDGHAENKITNPSKKQKIKEVDLTHLDPHTLSTIFPDDYPDE